MLDLLEARPGTRILSLMVGNHFYNTLDSFSVIRIDSQATGTPKVEAGCIISPLAHDTGQDDQFIFDGSQNGEISQIETIDYEVNRPCWGKKLAMGIAETVWRSRTEIGHRLI